MPEEASYPTADTDFRAAAEPTGSEFAELRESFLLAYTRSTALAYWSDLDSLYRWSVEQKLNIFDLSARDIERYLAAFSKRGYSPNTVARRLGTFRKFYNFVVE